MINNIYHPITGARISKKETKNKLMLRAEDPGQVPDSSSQGSDGDAGSHEGMRVDVQPSARKGQCQEQEIE